MATCPECDAEIEVDEFDVDKGDQFSCPDCGSNLEVVSLSPLEFDLASDEDEDEDEEEDDAPPTLEFDDSDPDGPDLVRVRLTPLSARAFTERSLRMVAAGRPPCPFCGLPLDPTGHICPRKNGYVH